MSFEYISDIIKILKERGEMLVLAESCTGGMIASHIVDISGASSIFDRGFVTYTNQAKQDCLHVSKNILETHGAVSSECAEAMAHGALKHSTAQWSLAVTGIAGPDGGSADKPVGLVYISIGSTHPPEHQTHHYVFDGSRAEIRQQAAKKSLELLYNRLALT